jgi:hypothetical protein
MSGGDRPRQVTGEHVRQVTDEDAMKLGPGHQQAREFLERLAKIRLIARHR